VPNPFRDTTPSPDVWGIGHPTAVPATSTDRDRGEVSATVIRLLPEESRRERAPSRKPTGFGDAARSARSHP